MILAGLVSGGFVNADTGDWAWLAGGGALFLPTLLMLLCRRKYPRWWFDWHLELTRFTTRVGAYVLLLRDEYPSTDEAQAVRLDLDYPDAAADLNRFLPIVKWLLAIPHYIVLIVLWVVRDRRDGAGLVRDPDHGPLPAPAVRLRAGRQPLVAARGGLYVAADDRPLPALPAGSVGLVGLGVADGGGWQPAEVVRGVGVLRLRPPSVPRSGGGPARSPLRTSPLRAACRCR